MKKETRDFIKYLIVGGWNTLFGLGLYYLFLFFTQKYSDYSYLLAGPISSELAIIQSFLAYKFLIFKTKGNYITEYLKIRAVYGIATLISLPILAFITEASKHFLTLKYQSLAPYIGGTATTIFTVLFSFFGQKKFVFKHSN